MVTRKGTGRFIKKKRKTELGQTHDNKEGTLSLVVNRHSPTAGERDVKANLPSGGGGWCRRWGVSVGIFFINPTLTRVILLKYVFAGLNFT